MTTMYRLRLVATHEDGTATSRSWPVTEELAEELVRVYLGEPQAERVLDVAYLARLRQLGETIPTLTPREDDQWGLLVLRRPRLRSGAWWSSWGTAGWLGTSRR